VRFRRTAANTLQQIVLIVLAFATISFTGCGSSALPGAAAPNGKVALSVTGTPVLLNIGTRIERRPGLLGNSRWRLPLIVQNYIEQ
jgi:hypothetical protein